MKPVTSRLRFVVNSKTWLAIGGLLYLFGINSLAFGQETHQAHTHGVANLTLAIENQALEMQFDSPAMSLLGFEHKPETNKQLEIIETTKSLLSSSTNVISIEGASCSSGEIDVDILGPAGETTAEITEPHAHQHSDDQPSEQDTNHSEVSAIYRFECVDTEKIRSVTVALFEAFPNLESINVNWLTETQQGQSTLTPKASTVELR